MANETPYDVVIVGAGIAGAQMAYKLAKAGKKVLVLEAGEYIPNVAQLFPVKQNNINKYFAAPIKDPSAPWPTPKNPSTPWDKSGIYAPRPTSPGVNSDNTAGDKWQSQGAVGNYLQQTGKYAFGSTNERVAGGTTKHWLGTCLRFVPDDFKVVSKYNPPVPGAYDWPINYDQLEKYYGMAENEIGVAGDSSSSMTLGATRTTPYPMMPIAQSYLDQILQQRLNNKNIDGNALDVVSTPQGRNSAVYDGRPACMGNSSCVPICPINAKYDAGVHIDKILNSPKSANSPNSTETVDLNQFVTFMWRTVAYQVTINPADNTVSGIKYKTWSNVPGQAIVDGVAVGKIYVIASHAIEAAKLLLNSPWGKTTVANSSDMVGRHLMDHICLVVWGNFVDSNGNNTQVYPYRGPLSSSGIESFRNTPQRSKTAAFRIEIGNDGWTWPYGGPEYYVSTEVSPTNLGKALFNSVQSNGQSAARFALELETISGDETMSSQVTLSKTDKDALGIPRPSVNYNLPQYTLDGYAYAITVAQRLFEAAGIQMQQNISSVPAPAPVPTVLTGGPGTMTFTPSIVLNPPIAFNPPLSNPNPGPINIEFRGAGHLIGTHRMGSDPKLSVTNGDLLCWDHSNLYLVGAGAFPSTATSNPTLTISALALRAADTIIASLGATS